jgi:hypothetical protein
VDVSADMSTEWCSAEGEANHLSASLWRRGWGEGGVHSSISSSLRTLDGSNEALKRFTLMIHGNGPTTVMSHTLIMPLNSSA